MKGLPADAFIARLAEIRDSLQARADATRGRPRTLAEVAATTLIDGMESIANAAAVRLRELTPRSPDGDDHIGDGWVVRRADTPGLVAFEVVNEHPKATETLRRADGSDTGITLLEILEYGSREHIIRPVNAKALHFVSKGGAEMFLQEVKHPGTEPYAMVARTAVDVALDVKRLIDQTRRELAIQRLGTTKTYRPPKAAA